MKILLDTHVLLWDLSGKPVLTPKMVYYLEDRDNTLFYSTVSLWEIAIKQKLHPDQLPFRAEQLFRYCEMFEYYRLDIQPEHIFALDSLQYADTLPPHKDPFDRLLIAQAKAEGMRFMTHDDKLAGYDEPCILRV